MFQSIVTEYLETKGLNQADLAKKIGISQQAISDFLSRSSKVRASTKRKYFDAISGLEEFYKKKQHKETYEQIEEELTKYKNIPAKYQTDNPRELLRIYLEYVANKDALMQFRRMKEEKEVEFLQMYIEIKDKYGSIEDYLSETI